MTTELPKGWVRTTLRALGTWTSGGTPRRSQPAYFGGTIPWVKTGDLQDSPVSTIPESLTEAGVENSSAKVFPPGTLLVAMYGATIGKLGVLIRPAATNQACAALLPSDANQELLPFTFYYLLSQRRALRRSGQGGAQPNISQTVIKGWEIPLAPLPEQRRIVAAIEQHFSRLDAAVSTLERVKAKLGQTRASVLKAAVEGRLVPTEAAKAGAEGRDYEHASVLLERILAERRERWEQAAWDKEVDKARQKAAKAHRKAKGRPLQRGEKLDPAEWEHLSEDEYRRYLPKGEKWKAKYKEPVEPDLAGLPVLPEGWAWATAEKITDSVRLIRYGILKPGPDLSPLGLPYVKVKHMRGDVIVPLRDLPRTSQAIFDKYAAAALGKGDLLIAIRGTYGRVALVADDLDGANITQDSARIAPLHGVKREYLRHALLAPDAQQYFKRVARGVAVKGVNIRDLRPAPVPLPPLAEQHRIVAEVDRQLSVLDEVGRLVDTNLARCARLRQAILKRAFEGRLVPQDPSDEPANVLLERIKAQAAATPKKNTRRRSGRGKA